MMNLYLLTQSVNRGYDTYDSCVVAAESEAEAVRMHPGGTRVWSDALLWVRPDGNTDDYAMWDWCHPSQVDCSLVGVAHESLPVGVLIASYNAG